MKSWKTTLFGTLALIGTLIPQFYPEFARHGAFLAALGSGLGLLFARDNNVTSEQAGAGKPSSVPILFKILLLVLFPAVFLCGCSPGGMAKLAAQLKNDPAIISAQVTTIYGTAKLTRVGGQTNLVSVSPDGTITVGK